MTILNMTYGQGNPYQPFHLNAISDLSVTGGNAEATITWSDPGNLVVDGQTLATWTSTKLVRKVGSAPSSSSDGTLVVTETVADTYSSNGYTDSGLINGTTYYYAAFAVADNGTEIISNVDNVTPSSGRTPGENTLAYYDFENDTGTTMVNQASTGSTYDGTYYTTPTYGTTADGKKYLICSSNYGYTPVIPFDYDNVTINIWVYYPTQNHEWYIFGTGRWGYAMPNIMNSCYNGGLGLAIGGAGVTLQLSSYYGWHLITLMSDGSNEKIYIDGNIVNTENTGYSNTNNYNIGVGTIYEQKHQTAKIFEGYFGVVMIEDKVRTDTEISDYYNQTKGDYGIS